MALNKRKGQYYYEHKQIDTSGAYRINDDTRWGTVLMTATERKIVLVLWVGVVVLFLGIALRVAYLAHIGYYNF